MAFLLYNLNFLKTLIQCILINFFYYSQNLETTVGPDNRLHEIYSGIRQPVIGNDSLGTGKFMLCKLYVIFFANRDTPSPVNIIK